MDKLVWQTDMVTLNFNICNFSINMCFLKYFRIIILHLFDVNTVSWHDEGGLNEFGVFVITIYIIYWLFSMENDHFI